MKYNQLNENVNLSEKEKEYLWSKVEYSKKKTAINNENTLFQLLKGDKKNFDESEFNTILNSLEYTFRKKLKGMDTPIKNDTFEEIAEKIPSDWFGVTYSSIDSKKKRDEKEPSVTDTKKHILSFLDFNKIDYKEDMSKKELISLIKKDDDE